MLTMIEVEIDQDGRLRPLEPLPFPLLGRAYLALLSDPSANRTPSGATGGATDAWPCLRPRASPNARSAIQRRCRTALRHSVRTGSTIDTSCLSRYLHPDLPDRRCGVVQRADTPIPGAKRSHAAVRIALGLDIPAPRRNRILGRTDQGNPALKGLDNRAPSPWRNSRDPPPFLMLPQEKQETAVFPRYSPSRCNHGPWYSSLDDVGRRSMQTITAQEARSNFSELLDHARREPVRVTRRGHVVGVMVSPEDYEAMRVFYAERLLDRMSQMGKMAEQHGLTEEELPGCWPMTARRAVIDTNVLISGALSPGGTAAAVTPWFIRYGRLIFSSETFAELESRLMRSKFDRYVTRAVRQDMLRDLGAVAEWVEEETGQLFTRSR